MPLDKDFPYGAKVNTTIGHEGTGEVVKIGSKVTGFKVGDVIGLTNAFHSCWKCAGCQVYYSWCSDSRAKLQGFAADGFMAEYAVVDPKAAIVLPEGMDVLRSPPIFCAGITAYNSISRAGLEPGQWLAVVGCGGLGQLAIRYAKAQGLQVIGIDVDDKILATAKEANVDYTFNSRSDPEYVTKLKEITRGGCHAANVYAAAKGGYDTATQVLRMLGRLVVVGISPVDISLSSMAIALGVYTVVGASNHANTERLRECAEFTLKHGIQSPSRFFNLDDIEKMVKIMENGQTEGQRLIVKF